MRENILDLVSRLARVPEGSRKARKYFHRSHLSHEAKSQAVRIASVMRHKEEMRRNAESWSRLREQFIK